MGVRTVTNVVTPAASYDLTDLATAKDEVGLKTTDTSNDAFLQRGISQVSSAIANYCNRVFQVETLIDTVDIERDAFPYQVPGGVPAIQLSRWPVVGMVSLTENGIALTEDTDFRVDYQKGLVYRLTVDGTFVCPWAALPVVVKYLAGFAIKAQQASSVPSAGPYSVTVTKSAAFVLDRGVSYANGTALVAVASAPAQGEYTVAAGVYTFAAADANAAVVINYSWQKIPDDLVDAALRQITSRFKQKGRDPALVSQNTPGVGEQRWWVGSVPGQNGTLPPEITGMLDGTYRVPVVG